MAPGYSSATTAIVVEITKIIIIIIMMVMMMMAKAMESYASVCSGCLRMCEDESQGAEWASLPPSLCSFVVGRN